MKKVQAYSIEEETLKQLDKVAGRMKYRSKSSIVQEAIQQWLKYNKEK